jgi:hypothetical protein
MTNDELAKLLEKPFIPIAPVCEVLNIALNTGYAAAKRGDIPTLKVCGTYRVPSAWLRAKLEGK